MSSFRLVLVVESRCLGNVGLEFLDGTLGLRNVFFEISEIVGATLELSIKTIVLVLETD